MPYQGRQPGVGVRNRFIYTATGGQTLFSGADSNGRTLAYQDGAYVDVYLNGVMLVPGTDFTATTKTSVSLTSGAAASDIVEIIAYDISSIADTVSKSQGGTFDGNVAVTGNLTVDTNTLFVDAASNNVGIGTSSPAQPNGSGLVIYDATLPRLTLRNSTTGTASTDGGGLLMSGANLFVTNRENGNLIFEAANATEHMRIDSSGNVGIGTASPASISGGYGTVTINGANGGGLALQSGGTTRGFIYVDSLGLQYSATTTNPHIWYTNGSERMRITSTGSVGIGTSSPLAKVTIDVGDNAPAASGNMTTGVVVQSAGASRALNMGVNNTAGYSWINAAFANNSHVPDNLVFMTGTTERMRIDASGRVGIGVTPSAWVSQFRSVDVSTASAFAGSDFGAGVRQTYVAHNCYYDGVWKYKQSTDAPFIMYIQDGILSFQNAVGGTAGNSFSFSERARIDSSGNLFVGTTSPPVTARFAVQHNVYGGYFGSTGTGGGSIPLIVERSNDDGIVIEFKRSAAVVGNINVTSTSTSYVTSSDYRLKENVVPLSGAADRLAQIPVHRFNFIADPDRTVDGFLAHEVQAFVPECVTGEKDAVDADGNPVYQGIDQSKLVPLLTAALQEALTKIEALEARITALEAQP